MLDATATWTLASEKPLTQWYGHVHLLPDHVVGQWFCVERHSGHLLWQSKLRRANTFCGVDSGVIVASEMRSDGPWTATFGCYGISLDSGTLLWTSHGTGIRGVLARLFDFFPGFTNELRDTPHHVEDGQVFCESGRVLDVKTGRLLKKITSDTVQAHEKPSSIDWHFYNTGMEKDHSRIAVGNGLFLRHAQEKEGMQRGVFKLAADTEDGNLVWQLSIEQLGRHIDGNFYSYRLVPPFIYLILSDESRYKPHPSQKHVVLPNPTRWHLVTLDLATGEVLQDFPLGDQKIEECRIEDVNQYGLLIGKSNNELVYYRQTT